MYPACSRDRLLGCPFDALTARLAATKPLKNAPDFQSTRSVRFTRQSFVTPSAATRVLTCLIALPALAATTAIDGLLKKIEERYNHSQTLKLDFSESYAGIKSPVQNESGVLYLRKPGRMRWEYTTPAGKLFLSDGKEVLTYSPADHSAEKGKLKESEDMHAPLAFLLGKLDFAKEFKSFQSRTEGADTWIIAEPKSENLIYSKVEFLATPDGEIHRVRVTGQDQSKLDFTFTNEQRNASVAPAMFIFHPPPGVQVVDAEKAEK
jgi:outer membrane lipoprotein carrier protein